MIEVLEDELMELVLEDDEDELEEWLLSAELL